MPDPEQKALEKLIAKCEFCADQMLESMGELADICAPGQDVFNFMSKMGIDAARERFPSKMVDAAVRGAICLTAAQISARHFRRRLEALGGDDWAP
jgi:hypothetical protein